MLVMGTGSFLLTKGLAIVTYALIWMTPMWANLKYRQRRGCVFITGCDSGMGQATVVYLAQTQTASNHYEQIFAGCFSAKASQEYFEKTLTPEQLKYVTVVPLDVTNDGSIQAACATVNQWRADQSKKFPDQDFGLTGLCMYHGIAYNGPAAYMPMGMYERQLQVNFLGFVRVIQHFLPVMQTHASPNLSGRIVLTGTGGGPCSPCPPLLTAYMASKFATEAYCQSLRQELFMTSSPIEVLMINPGFVKPTMLMEEGKKLTQKMWELCEAKIGSSRAKDEYGPMMNHFMEYSAQQPGTHVTKVCEAAEHALLAHVPKSSYKVGIDSKLAPIVGMLPTGVRETIARHGIYGVLSPVGTVQGYRV
jgi:NAD(P)-dependent dehydrogenase (short-subunit alcohol dehydrogenase family)